MPKPISWSYRIHEIRDRVNHSKLQSWSRRELEELFDVRRASAQSLMKAIGGIQNIGGTHLVDRDALIEFLDRSLHTDNLSETVQKSRLEAGPAPKNPQKLTFSLPPELRTVMAGDLPERIRLEPGKLTITGVNALEIVESLYLLAQAMQNDLDSIEQMLDPAPLPPAVADDDLRNMFKNLKMQAEVRPD